MDPIEQLIELSRRYGRDDRFVIAGGGNTSYKDADHLWVKASGHALATITEEGFAVLDRKRLAPMAGKAYSADPALREQEVKEDLARATLTPGRRPSVETSLHDCLDTAFVVHLHPMLVGGLMCATEAERRCAELFPDALYIEYTDPGYTLFKKVFDRMAAWKEEKGVQPRIIFLQNHGVFVGGDSPEEIDAAYDRIVRTLEQAVEPLPQGPLAPDPGAVDLLPAIRQILSRNGRGPKTLQVTRDALTEAMMDTVTGPFTPDMIVYCKSDWVRLAWADVQEAERQIEDFISRKGYLPKVLLIPGIGLVAAGDDAREAQTVTAVFHDALRVAWFARSFGGPHPMEPEWVRFIEGWEAEQYRRSLGAVRQRGRVEGRTIVITGAAQGFGAGIARILMQEGANIVVADLNEETGRKTTEALSGEAGANRALFVRTDVSDPASVDNLLRETVLHFGGVDTFISNAGVLRAGGLQALTPEQFEFVTRINYNAYFYCARAAARVMRIQTAADPDYFADIIQINSKSGLRGSKANFAYAGSKFGGVGLTQSFALELAPDRIKVNSICPGNYYDGPLWSDPERGLFVQYLAAGKVPGAQTVEDVRAFYLSQVPMRKGCTPDDVAKAILYAIDQTGETGQAIPVTGGQVMLA